MKAIPPVTAVPIDQAQPGMILAKGVFRPDGPLLCPADKPLTETLIDRFRQAGVQSVHVRAGGEAAEADRARIAADIEARFALTAGDPVLERLKEAVLRRLAPTGAGTADGQGGEDS